MIDDDGDRSAVEGPSKEPLGQCAVLCYGVGHMLNDITSSCWFTYLLLFLTEIGLSPSDAAVVTLSGQGADAFATIFAGELIDRFGHFKLWHAGGSILVAISFSSVFGGCLLCQILGSQSVVLETVGYSIFAAIFNVGWALTQVAHMSMVNCITLNQTSRVVLSSCRNAFTMVANLSLYAIALAVFSIKKADTPTATQYQYRWIAYASILIGACFVIIFLAGTREPRWKLKNTRRYHERISWSRWFKKVLYFQVAAVYTLMRLATNVSQALLTYFLINDLQMVKSSKALVPAVIYIFSFAVLISLQKMKWSGIRLKLAYSIGAILWIFCGALIDYTYCSAILFVVIFDVRNVFDGSSERDLISCNAVMEGCCKELGFIIDAEKVVETMSELRIWPEVASFGHLASLSTLELSNAFFVNLSLQQLSGLKTKLEKLVFLSTGIFTNVAFLFSADDMYHFVHLEYVVFLSHLMSGDIATSMVNVEVVKFDHCVDLTDSHFFAIMSVCRNLREILNTETSKLLNLKERVYLERDSGSICLSLSMNNEDSTVESIWEGEFVVSNSPEESVTVESDAQINIDGNEATDSSDNQAIHVQFLENPRAIEDMMDRYWLPIGWARIEELVQMVKVDSGRNVEKTEFAYDEDDLTVANVAAPYWERPAGPTWWCHVDPLHPAVVAWLKSPQWLHPAVSIALTNESRLISERRKHLFYEVPVRVVGGLLFELLGQSVGDPHSYEDDSPIVPRSWQAQNFLVTAFHIKGNSSNINILGITEVREMFFDGWLWCAEKYS